MPLSICLPWPLAPPLPGPRLSCLHFLSVDLATVHEPCPPRCLAWTLWALRGTIAVPFHVFITICVFTNISCRSLSPNPRDLTPEIQTQVTTSLNEPICPRQRSLGCWAWSSEGRPACLLHTEVCFGLSTSNKTRRDDACVKPWHLGDRGWRLSRFKAILSYIVRWRLA